MSYVLVAPQRLRSVGAVRSFHRNAVFTATDPKGKTLRIRKTSIPKGSTVIILIMPSTTTIALRNNPFANCNKRTNNAINRVTVKV